MAALNLDLGLVRSQILEYLLYGAWDIENSRNLLTWIWNDMLSSPTKENFEWSCRNSMKALELGQSFDVNFTGWLQFLGLDDDRIFDTEQHEYLRKAFEFFIKHGLDIESRDNFRKETPLLISAEADTWSSATCLRVFLGYGADLTAVDYKGRGPLHLTLKQSRDET